MEAMMLAMKNCDWRVGHCSTEISSIPSCLTPWTSLKTCVVDIYRERENERKRQRETPLFLWLWGLRMVKYCLQCGRSGFNPGLGRSSGGGHGSPFQNSCLEDPHEQRSLAGYSPWSCRVRPDSAAKHNTAHSKLWRDEIWLRKANTERQPYVSLTHASSGRLLLCERENEGSRVSKTHRQWETDTRRKADRWCDGENQGYGLLESSTLHHKWIKLDHGMTACGKNPCRH